MRPPRVLGLLPRLVVAAVVLLVIAGIVWNGVAFATFERIWRQLIQRPGEPMSFRFILQPTMATIAAIKDGRRDDRLGRSPYFWAMLRDPQRADRSD